MTELAPRLSAIVAMSENRVIGRDNGLPWHLPADLAHFKKLTLNKPIIMGRKTFESIGKALPKRTNIVVTRQGGWKAPDALVAHSLEQALDLGNDHAREMGADEVLVIGGALLFEEVLPICDTLHLTLVHAVVEGDVFFPEFDRSQWREVGREEYSADDRHAAGFTILQLQHLSSAARI